MKRITKGTEAPPAKRSKRATLYNRVPLASKQRETTTSVVASSRTLHALALDSFPFGTAVTNRERNKLLFKAVKINAAYRTSSANGRMFRWAVVAPKILQPINDLPTNFFTGYDGERGLSFSIALDGLTQCHYPINRETHNVIAQGSEWLGGNDFNKEVYPQEFTWSKYIPLNKMLTFDGGATDLPYQRHYFVFWWDSPLAPAGEGVSTTNSDCRIRATQYFSDAV